MKIFIPNSAPVRSVTAATLTLVTAVAAAPVLAEESKRAVGTLEEVIVTAQRREENLQAVPIAVTAFSGEEMSSSGAAGTLSLPQLVPSVQLVRSGPSGMFFVRGVGNTSGGTGEEGANAFYVDGVAIPDLKQAILKFNNIERVEVLKGPQGTLFGRNSSGGLVNVITRTPGDEFEAKFKVGAANYDTSTVQGYIAGPLTDTLSADIAITSTDQGEGWGHNTITGDDVAKGWDWGARSKWVWNPNDTTTITTVFEYTKQSDDFTTSFRLAPESVGFGLPMPASFLPPSDPYDTSSVDEQYNEQHSYGVAVTAEFDLGWATLTSITAHRDNENEAGIDTDTGAQTLSHIEIPSSTKSLQQEFRLASNDTDKLSWQAGVFLLRTESNLKPEVFSGALLGAFGGGFNLHSTLNRWSSSPFGEITYQLTDATQIIAGARFTVDKYSIDSERDPFNAVPTTAFVDTEDDEEGTYRLALRHDLDENTNVYVSYNRGFKGGTYPMESFSAPAVTSQVIDAYEVGLKTLLLDSRLRLNLAAFVYDIEDFQVRSTVSIPAPTTMLLNAGEGIVHGFEMDFEALLTDNFRVFGALTWLDTEFASFDSATYNNPNPAAVGGNTATGRSAKDNELPLAPDLAANLGIAYTIPLSQGQIDMKLLYSFNDGYYFEADNRLEQPAFDTINASVIYRMMENWSVELWGNNLGDETYYVQKLSSVLSDIAVAAAPRTYGISVEYTY